MELGTKWRSHGAGKSCWGQLRLQREKHQRTRAENAAGKATAGRQAEIELEQSVRARPSTGGKSKSAPGLNSDQNKQHHRETEGNRETKSSDHLEQATGLAGAGTEQRMVDLGNDTWGQLLLKPRNWVTAPAEQKSTETDTGPLCREQKKNSSEFLDPAERRTE
jgi:hypothetical protein